MDHLPSDDEMFHPSIYARTKDLHCRGIKATLSQSKPRIKTSAGYLKHNRRWNQWPGFAVYNSTDLISL